MPRGIALTLRQVEAIQADLAKPGADKQAIADKYGLTVRTIYGLDKVRRDLKGIRNDNSLPRNAYNA